MTFGAVLHKLSRRRGAVIFSAVVALVVTVSAIYRIHLSPPGIASRDFQIGAASAQVLIDTPRSSILDTGTVVGPVSLDPLTIHSTLIGDVMATYAVRAYIARIMGLPTDRIEVSAPITANVPRTTIEPGSGHTATDLLTSPAHYKLEVQTDPTVPLLYLYTQAPSKSAAVRLANASVQGLRNYLSDLARRQHVSPAHQVTITQLGSVDGGVVNQGVAIEIGILVFVTTFGISCAILLFVARVREGWRLEALASRTQS